MLPFIGVALAAAVGTAIYNAFDDDDSSSYTSSNRDEVEREARTAEINEQRSRILEDIEKYAKDSINKVKKKHGARIKIFIPSSIDTGINSENINGSRTEGLFYGTINSRNIHDNPWETFTGANASGYTSSFDTDQLSVDIISKDDTIQKEIEALEKETKEIKQVVEGLKRMQGELS